jgi:hypothetical protein
MSRTIAPPAEETPLFGAEPGRLKNVKLRDLLVRFAFGAMISFAAGIISIVVNPVAGGMFLAFPAILPATITLIEKREGTDEAVADTQGSVIGAGGLVFFALTVGLLLPRTDAPVALLAAFVAWLLASFAGYVLVERFRRRGRQPHAPGELSVGPSYGRPGIRGVRGSG